jgi:hypothetical protein
LARGVDLRMEAGQEVRGAVEIAVKEPRPLIPAAAISG